MHSVAYLLRVYSRNQPILRQPPYTEYALCVCYHQTKTDYPALIDEWAVRFFQEMDYAQEARNAIQFREDMQSLDGIVVPEFYPELCTRKVLVSEWIEGKPCSLLYLHSTKRRKI